MKPALLQTLLALAAAAVSAGAGAQTASQEQAYPSKPIRILVPFTAGSATDIIARVVSPRMADLWGRPVVIDNRPSAGGIVAFGLVADAAPDGHTLLVTGSNFAGSAALYAGKLPFDPVKDFSGVTQFATTPLVLVVSPALGAKSVNELIALAREKKGQLNFASTGHGSGTHYGAELFMLARQRRASQLLRLHCCGHRLRLWRRAMRSTRSLGRSARRLACISSPKPSRWMRARPYRPRTRCRQAFSAARPGSDVKMSMRTGSTPICSIMPGCVKSCGVIPFSGAPKALSAS